MKIVIVDDDMSIRNMLRALCESAGHEVIAEFSDGVGLLDCVSANRPDVVCLDFHLPGKDGLALLSLLMHKCAKAFPLDVILITGSESPELKGQAADLGATGFIQKPFEPVQIIAELKAIEETRGIAAKVTEQPMEAVAEPPVAVQEIGIVPRTAVIVDDNSSVRLLLKGILESIGVKVIGSAANGKAGIAVVREKRPALVCLDVEMPGMSGIEALPEVCAASPQSKVVMVTGNASRPIVEAAASGGAKGYLLKPIRPAKVEEFVKKLLQL